tara:strand:+ start:3146 stop:3388 length:243 start_codon:yes stop_codon:yes gene_type:complete
MTKALKIFSAVALSAAMALPAFADDIPLNSTVSGGAGQANVDGQTTLLSGELEAGIAIGATAAVIVALAGSNNATVTSTP